jgi:UDPglucose 6-dehydrogenase
MKIGIIGVGAVGGACKKGFELLGHEVKVHDPKFNSKIEDVSDTDIVYVCVPTPESTDGSCDLSIVRHTINELEKLAYGKLPLTRRLSIGGKVKHKTRKN